MCDFRHKINAESRIGEKP